MRILKGKELVCLLTALAMIVAGLNLSAATVTGDPHSKKESIGNDRSAYNAVNDVINAMMGELSGGRYWGDDWHYEYDSGITGSGLYSIQYSLWYDGSIHRSRTGMGGSSDFTVEDTFGTTENDPDNYARTRSDDMTVEMEVTIDSRPRNPGDASFVRIHYTITNTGSGTEENVSFFVLADQDIPELGLESDDDTSDYDSNTDFVWTRDDEYIAGFSGKTLSDHHGMEQYAEMLWQDDGDGELNGNDNFGPLDVGVGEQWRIGDLTSQESWSVIIEYWFNSTNSVTADAGGPYEGPEGSSIDFDASGSIGIGPLEFRWSFDGGSSWGSWSYDPTGSHTWYDDHVGTVCVEVRDGYGTTDQDCADVTVTNVDPDVDAWATPNPVLEGSDVTFDGEFSDPGTDDTHTTTWNFGDGSPPVLGSFSPGQGYENHYMNSIIHAYGHCGNYQASLTVDDDDGGQGIDYVPVSVSNVNPSVTLFPPDPVDPPEGSPVTFDGYFDDPSWLDSHTAEWDFGDGETEPGDFDPKIGETHHEMYEIDHTYGHGGDYTVTLTIWDNCGGMGQASQQITVDNVPPSVTIWANPSPADEGQDVAFDGYFDDPSWLDSHTAQWDFGDGGTEAGDFNPKIGHTHHEMEEATHAYGKAGTYQVTLTVEDDMNGIGVGSIYIDIINVDPTVSISAVPTTVDEGDTVTFDGFFDDPSWLDEHTAVWDFGDGWTQEGVFSPGPGEGNTHHVMDQVTYRYGKAGIYSACLEVTDEFTGFGSDCIQITVINVDPTVTAHINTHTVNEGSPFTVNGSFDDPSWNDTYPVIEWDFEFEDTVRGLGPTEPGQELPPPPEWDNTHHEVAPVEFAYGDDGNYTITLTVEDEFQGSGSDSEYVVVANVPPSVLQIEAILHQNAPRTHGYWKHQCKVKNPNPDHPGIRQEWVDAIRQQSTVFTDVQTKDDVCDYLDPNNPITPMKKAKKQLMALWLNVVSELLWIDSPLHHPDAPDDDSVREFIEHAEDLILNDPTEQNLNWVNDIACDINEDADDQDDWSYIDPLVGEYNAYAHDPGTDDLQFVWEDGLEGTDNIIHYKFFNGQDFEPDYDESVNHERTPQGLYPFEPVDKLIVGYPPDVGAGVTAELLCLRDDDDGISPDADKDCSDGWGAMSIGISIAWSFGFTISYRSVSGGYIIAEVDATFTSCDTLVVPIVTGGRIE